MYTPTELQLLEASYKEVKGVTVLDQGRPGPTVAIFAVTHGNEISGFDALAYLLQDAELSKQEIHGRIFFVVHNLKAFRRYRSEEEKRDLGDTEFRCLDMNLNRIYDDKVLNDPQYQDAYEIQRAKEIIRLIPEFDYVLDLHSTSRPSDPMLISSTGNEDERISGALFFYRHVLNLFEKIPGKPLLDYVKLHGRRGKDTVAIAVECGSHFQSSSRYCARKTSLRFLHAAGVLPQVELDSPDEFQVTRYDVLRNIMPLYPDFHWAKAWSGFEKVKRGTVLALERGEEILADDDYILIMPTANPKPGGDGVYLAKTVA